MHSERDNNVSKGFAPRRVAYFAVAARLLKSTSDAAAR